MVDPVNKLSHALAALRAERARAQRGRSGGGAGKSAGTVAASTARDRDDRGAALKQAIVMAVAAIDPHAEDRRQRARRVFVEQVLQFEFGREIRMDRRFGAMVRQVAGDLCSDEASAAELDAQIDLLVGAHSSSASAAPSPPSP
jgi:hypothetical protein